MYIHFSYTDNPVTLRYIRYVNSYTAKIVKNTKEKLPSRDCLNDGPVCGPNRLFLLVTFLVETKDGGSEPLKLVVSGGGILL